LQGVAKCSELPHGKVELLDIIIKAVKFNFTAKLEVID